MNNRPASLRGCGFIKKLTQQRYSPQLAGYFCGKPARIADRWRASRSWDRRWVMLMSDTEAGLCLLAVGLLFIYRNMQVGG